MINNHHYMMGGSETVYFETAKLLQENRHEVVFFSAKEKKTIDDGFNKYFIKAPILSTSRIIDKFVNAYKFIYSDNAKKQLERLIIEERPDIAHLHIFYGILSSSILPVLKKYNIPVVMSVHEYRMMCPSYTMLDQDYEICEKCSDGNYMHCIANRCNKGSMANSIVSATECFIRDKFFSYERYIDKFIMVSKFIQEKHVHYKKSLEAKSVHLYNFISLPEVSIKEKCNYHLYIGRLSREKGLYTLIKAFQTQPGLNLKIAGTGPMAVELQEYCKQHKLANIEFLGFVSGTDKENCISSARFVIVPSEWYENNPMSIIESFSLGTPVIGADIGGIPELVQNDKTGYLFKSGSIDELVYILKKIDQLPKERYQSLTVNSLNFADKHFNKNKHYEKLITIYQEVIEKQLNTDRKGIDNENFCCRQQSKWNNDDGKSFRKE